LGVATGPNEELNARYSDGSLEICGGQSGVCEDFSGAEDLICERHVSGNFNGTPDRERIFGSIGTVDNIDGMGGKDIILSRGLESDVVTLGADGGTILLDPFTGPEQSLDITNANGSLGGPVTIRIVNQVEIPALFFLVRGFNKGDKLVYDAEDGSATLTYEEVDRVTGHDADGANPNYFRVGVGEDTLFACLESAWPGLDCHFAPLSQ